MYSEKITCEKTLGKELQQEPILVSNYCFETRQSAIVCAKCGFNRPEAEKFEKVWQALLFSEFTNNPVKKERLNKVYNGEFGYSGLQLRDAILALTTDLLGKPRDYGLNNETIDKSTLVLATDYVSEADRGDFKIFLQAMYDHHKWTLKDSDFTQFGSLVNKILKQREVIKTGQTGSLAEHLPRQGTETPTNTTSKQVVTDHPSVVASAI